MNDVLKQSLVVEYAKSFIGKVKYQMGAQNPEGGISDCSGFTQYIYKLAGYDIPRTTGGVWDSDLQTINRQSLQTGDLILFKNTYNSGYTDGVSHIGIYSGNGKFIHCCSAGVVESKLSDSYYNNHYLGAKRVIGGTSTSTESSENNSDVPWWDIQGQINAKLDDWREKMLEVTKNISIFVIATLCIVGGAWFIVRSIQTSTNSDLF